jgi:RNA polymerase sigma factor (sigma-70 family)
MRIEPVEAGNIVASIQRGEDAGTMSLYRIFRGGVRVYLSRRVSYEDVDDRVHDAFMVVVEAIRAGTLRDPERLLGFVRTVARRQVGVDHQHYWKRRDRAAVRNEDVRDRGLNPEQLALRRERVRVMEEKLVRMRASDREILVRFYRDEQTEAEICEGMQLTATQFRLKKSRAKAKLVGRVHG